MWSVAVSAKTTWLFVRVDLDGAAGHGEATAFGSEASVVALLEALAAHVAERAADGAPLSPAETMQAFASRHASDARRAAASAVEQALLDAMARRADLPLAVMLGGGRDAPIRVYANINRSVSDRSPDGFAARARAVVAEGYRAVKIAPFDGYVWNSNAERPLLDAGLARIGAVHDAVGRDVDLMVDCHGRFDLATARLVLRECEAAAPYWIEDPVEVHRMSPDAQRALRGAAHDAGIRIAGGEALVDLVDTRRLLDAGGHDVILPDLRLTGVRTGMAMLALAGAYGVGASLHNPVGPVLDAVSRHAAAALPGFLVLERQVGESDLGRKLAGETAPVDGVIGLGEGAGTGLTLDEDVLAQSSRTPETTLTFAGMAGAGPDG